MSYLLIIALAVGLIFSPYHKIENANYSLIIPENWVIEQSADSKDLVLVAPKSGPSDLFRENVIILSRGIKLPFSKEEYYRQNIEVLERTLEDFDLEKSADERINGLLARKIVFSHTIGVINAKVIQYLILADSKAYILNFTADNIDFKKFRGEFERIAASFRIGS